ncbi:MAG: PhoU domain-containing protein [Actinomycetota bacterium]
MATRAHFQNAIEGFRTGLVGMASLALAQVEHAVAAWEDLDAAAAAEVIAGDEQVDDLCLELDQRIFTIQVLEAPVARDMRLLHVGLIAVIALERVGDLAVSIANLATEVPREGAVPEVQSVVRRMSARAVDALAESVQAIARTDVELAARTITDAKSAQQLMAEVLAAVSRAPDSTETRMWATAAVLVARHLDRVANNAAELAGRVRFLATGETYERHPQAEAPGSPPAA